MPDIDTVPIRIRQNDADPIRINNTAIIKLSRVCFFGISAGFFTYAIIGIAKEIRSTGNVVFILPILLEIADLFVDTLRESDLTE